MQAIREFLKRHSLPAGVVLMFVLTWPIDLAHAGVFPLQVPFAVYILLGWGFIFASLIMTGLTQGKAAVLALLRRFLIWRVSLRWYLVAFLLFPLIFSAGVGLNALLSQSPVDFSTVFARQFFDPSASLPLLVLPYFLFEAIANGEEMGWRGYVLPRLQSRYNALASSLVLGLIWAFWHLPKFLEPGNTSSVALFGIKILAEAVIYTWLYNNTGGSLLLVTCLHAAGNTAGFFLPIANTASGDNFNALLLSVALQVLAAVLVIVLAGPAHLSRSMPRQEEAGL